MKQSYSDLLVLFLSELLGTALLLFIGCMGCVDGGGYKPTHLSICLGFGLALMLIINIFGAVSGAHLNPAISLAALVYKNITVTAFFVYSAGQFVGGFLGYALLRSVLPSQHFGDSGKFCVTLPSVGSFQALAIEFIITMVLILVCCGIWDPRNANHHDSVPLRFGLTITCLALVAGSYSGGSMNPARSLAPALYTGVWDAQWIYWVGPFTAAMVTSVAFKAVFWREAPKKTYDEVPMRDP